MEAGKWLPFPTLGMISTCVGRIAGRDVVVLVYMYNVCRYKKIITVPAKQYHTM